MSATATIYHGVWFAKMKSGRRLVGVNPDGTEHLFREVLDLMAGGQDRPLIVGWKNVDEGTAKQAAARGIALVPNGLDAEIEAAIPADAKAIRPYVEIEGKIKASTLASGDAVVPMIGVRYVVEVDGKIIASTFPKAA